MKLFPKDATTVGEKLVYAIGFGIPVILYLFMQLSAFGIFHNFYSIACAAVGWGWKIPGILCTVIVIRFVYVAAADEVDDPPKPIHMIVVAALSLLFYCGFAYPYIF